MILFMKLIDTHSHLFLEEFSEDRPLVIKRAKSAGISKVFMPNIDSSTITSLLQVAREYSDFCYPMIGLHPTSVNRDYLKELKVVKNELEQSNKYVAVGEVGIDLYWDKTYKQEQLIVFRQQIEWAIEYNLPLIIHTREAFNEVYSSLYPYKNETISGIFHSFGGTYQEAEKLLEFENFKLGINGVVTFKNSGLSETLKSIPLSRIVMETDSPYLAPVPYRGKRNESSYLKEILYKLAEIYRLSRDEVAYITTNNALNVFKMTEVVC